MYDDDQKNILRHPLLWFVIIIILAMVLVLAVFRPAPVAADGCNPDTQDCSMMRGAAGEYWPEQTRPRSAQRSAPHIYAISPEIIRKRKGSKCGDNIPVWECERQFARARAMDQRRARLQREARESYRDSRGRKVIVIDDRDRRDRSDGSRCKKRITVTSKPRMTEALACGEARKLWSMQAIDDHGGKYGRLITARGVETDPHPMHEGAWRKVCTVSAVPCRGDRDAD